MRQSGIQFDSQIRHKSNQISPRLPTFAVQHRLPQPNCSPRLKLNNFGQILCSDLGNAGSPNGMNAKMGRTSTVGFIKKPKNDLTE